MPIVPATDSAPPDTAQLQALLIAKRPPVVFRSNDIITVNVAGIEDYAVKQRVSEQGTIVFPLIGRIQVAGLTIEQLQQAITEALKSGGMVRDAQVTIISEERPKEVVSVLGDVGHPGIYPALGDLTVAEYLSEASGFVESVPNSLGGNSAASFNVTLIRPGLDAPVRIPISAKPQDSAWGRIPLFPGDQIRVEKVGIVYAVGAVKAQGSFSLKNSDRTTVTQLIALAGGVGYEADGGGTHTSSARTATAPRSSRSISFGSLRERIQMSRFSRKTSCLFQQTSSRRSSREVGLPSSSPSPPPSSTATSAS